jgi:hypothetical protein
MLSKFWWCWHFRFRRALSPVNSFATLSFRGYEPQGAGPDKLPRAKHVTPPG